MSYCFDEIIAANLEELYKHGFNEKKGIEMSEILPINQYSAKDLTENTFIDNMLQLTNKNDNVNHPSHYTAYNGLEIIDLTEQMNFNRGNAVKYICRAGLKNSETEIEDLEKAIWYINREIKRIRPGLKIPKRCHNVC